MPEKCKYEKIYFDYDSHVPKTHKRIERKVISIISIPNPT
jgi:hypothetical protein